MITKYNICEKYKENLKKALELKLLMKEIENSIISQDEKKFNINIIK
jgi:hypothetical protein